MGWIATIVLGIIGSFVGGLIAWVFGFGRDPYQAGGCILSIVGAVAALLICCWAVGARRGRRRWVHFLGREKRPHTAQQFGKNGGLVPPVVAPLPGGRARRSLRPAPG